MGVYTGPASTVSAGQTAGVAAAINGVVNGVNAFGALTAYTPTVSTWALGNGSASGAYCQVEKNVWFRVVVTVGSTTTIGSTLGLTFPVTAASGVIVNYPLTVQLNHTGVSAYVGAARVASSTNFLAVSIGANGLHTNLSSTVPFTWAAGDTVVVTGWYEAA